MPNRLILVIAFCSLALSIAYYLIPELQRDVGPIIGGLELSWLFAALAATLLHYFAEAFRWWCYLRGEGTGSHLLRRLFAIFSLTALVTYLLPLKLGVPLRVYLLCSQLRISFKIVSATLLVDGVLSYGFWTMTTITLFFILPEIQGLHPSYLWGAAGVTAIFALLVFFWSKSRGGLGGWLSHVRAVKPHALVAASVILMTDILGYVLRHATIVWSLGADIRVSEIALATVASITAGFLSMLPMGIGAYDVTLVFLLTTFGVPAELAIFVPIINRAANVLIAVLLGLPASYFTGVSLLTLRQRYSDSPGARQL